MKTVLLIFSLFCVPCFLSAQSTNKAQLKSALLKDTMQELDIEPEIIEVYEKIADSLHRELGEEIKPRNIGTLTVNVYGLTGYDEFGNPSKGGIIDRKLLDIISSDKSRDIIIDEDTIYVRSQDKVIIKTIDGEVKAEHFLDFNDWSTIGAAANAQLELPLTWQHGYTIAGTPEISTPDRRYLIMFFGEEEGWIIFMPGNEAKRLEL
ncbi:MAG: hypothetical protein LBF78_15970 [Treponema sp.]|jgi:hypothetical protein|nr:hypothetical protein [Treponema sp.]